MEDNSFVNLIKFNTCFKAKPGNCTDLILTNKPKGFHNTGVMETGVSDHCTLAIENYKQSETNSFL